MNLKLAGFLTALAVGGVAFAQTDRAGRSRDERGEMDRDQRRPDEGAMQGQGGRDRERMVPNYEMGQHEVKGRVVAMTGHTLMIQTNGGVVPLEVNDQTTIDGNRLRRRGSDLRNIFREGDEVGASFDVRRGRGDKREYQALNLDRGMTKFDKDDRDRK